jgi:hypothetical protein
MAAATLPQTPALTDQTAAVTAQALPPPAQTQAQGAAAQAAAAQPKTADAKDKTEVAKTARVEGAPSAAAPAGAAVKPGEAVAQAASAGNAGKDANADARDPNAGPASEAKAPPPADAGQQQPAFAPATNAAAQAASPAAMAHAAAVRGSPQTVASLAAEIAKKLDGRSTRFDVQLDPAGLGKVDVRVEIDAAGKMTAAMNFDSQQSADELKSRAGELQRALEQAGFDLSGGLSFDVAGQGGQNQAQGQDQSAPGFRGRAFQAVLDGGADSALATQTYSRSASGSGVDIRI